MLKNGLFAILCIIFLLVATGFLVAFVENVGLSDRGSWTRAAEYGAGLDSDAMP